MRVAIINYGMGNLGSVSRALTELGAKPFIAENPEALADSDRMILPGVGSFADGITHLEERGWMDRIRSEASAGKPLLGICLGMHLLATRGNEGGDHNGLDLIPGSVKRLDEFGCEERIPHAGWNNIELSGKNPSLFAGIPSGADFYFVHSYAFEAADGATVLANTDYGVPLAAAIARGNVFGTQFHPEKSSKAGFRLLKNFLDPKLC